VGGREEESAFLSLGYRKRGEEREERVITHKKKKEKELRRRPPLIGRRRKHYLFPARPQRKREGRKLMTVVLYCC